MYIRIYILIYIYTHRVTNRVEQRKAGQAPVSRYRGLPCHPAQPMPTTSPAQAYL